MSRGVSYDTTKRLIDVVAAGVGLVTTLPLQAVIALLVFRDVGRPVIFRQPRPGRDGVVFELVKFRSMRQPDPGTGLVSDRDRLTPFGARLRATSLDELPSLWNVFRGDMSFVGPRPLLVQYLARYAPEQARRHQVRPGITGLAQVSGRNSLSWEEKLRLDTVYVDQRCLLLDLRLVVRTVLCVISRDGITSGESATMAEFEGVGSDG